MGAPKINPDLYVPIEFVDLDGTVHTARDWVELAAKVTGYRERRRIPIGDPSAEIVTQVCDKWPDRCTKGRSFQVIRGELNKRILHWVGTIVGLINSIGFVSGEEASRRAAICSACPKQRTWQGTCAACRMQVNRVAKELLKGKTPNDQMKKLEGCDVLGEDTRVSIWLKQTPVAVSDLPENCWRRE